MKSKVIVVLGTTSSGKSDIAVKVAKKVGGEIISADSRQVYKGMNLGSGKITKKEMRGIPHHLLDVTSPKMQFSVAKYKKLALKAIENILEKGKVPIICGGTGYYLDAVTKNIVLPEVEPNIKLRKELEEKSKEELFEILLREDKRRAENIDKNNKVRLVRAIEIVRALGNVPEIVEGESPYDFIYIGLDLEDVELKERIEKRLLKRLRAGMVDEVRNLHKSGVSWRRLESFGLEYKNCALFLQCKITDVQLKDNILRDSWQYVKRQRTWFKRNKKIKWYNWKDIISINKYICEKK